MFVPSFVFRIRVLFDRYIQFIKLSKPEINNSNSSFNLNIL